MNDFWNAFWPNFASTAVGVVSGLPAALWLNRQAIAHGEGVRTSADRHRLAQALSVVAEAIRHNSSNLDNLLKILGDNQALFDISLDTSAWEAVRADFSSEIEPGVRRRLAFHFQRLETLVTLNDLYLSFIIGTNASMSSAEGTKEKLGPLLATLATEQRNEGLALIEAIDTAVAKLKPSGS